MTHEVRPSSCPASTNSRNPLGGSVRVQMMPPGFSGSSAKTPRSELPHTGHGRRFVTRRQVDDLLMFPPFVDSRATVSDPSQQFRPPITDRAADRHRGRGRAARRMAPKGSFPDAQQPRRLGRREKFGTYGFRRLFSSVGHGILSNEKSLFARRSAPCRAFAVSWVIGAPENRTPNETGGKPLLVPATLQPG